jgi:hypothetical protein
MVVAVSLLPCTSSTGHRRLPPPPLLPSAAPSHPRRRKRTRRAAATMAARLACSSTPRASIRRRARLRRSRRSASCTRPRRRECGAVPHAAAGAPATGRSSFSCGRRRRPGSCRRRPPRYQLPDSLSVIASVEHLIRSLGGDLVLVHDLIRVSLCAQEIWYPLPPPCHRRDASTHYLQTNYFYSRSVHDLITRNDLDLFKCTNDLLPISLPELHLFELLKFSQ